MVGRYTNKCLRSDSHAFGTVSCIMHSALSSIDSLQFFFSYSVYLRGSCIRLTGRRQLTKDGFPFSEEGEKKKKKSIKKDSE